MALSNTQMPPQVNPEGETNQDGNNLAAVDPQAAGTFKFEPEKSQMEYCKANNGDSSFLICNDLVIEVLPNYFREYPNSSSLIIIGPSDE